MTELPKVECQLLLSYLIFFHYLVKVVIICTYMEAVYHKSNLVLMLLHYNPLYYVFHVERNCKMLFICSMLA